MGAHFAAQILSRGRRREAVRVEVLEDGSSVGTAVIERGEPLRRKGYSVYLTDLRVTGRHRGKLAGLISFTVVRRPGLWVVYAGMILVALGVPWLLWSRFRHVPDAVSEES